MSQAADRYQQLSSTPPGKFLVGRLGLPESTPLRRYEPGQPLLDGAAVVGGAPEHRLLSTVERVLKNTNTPALAPEAAAGASDKVGAIVFDASGITKSEDLSALREFFNPVITKLGSERPPDRPRHAARARRRPTPSCRSARAGGLRPLRRQGAAPRRDRQPRLRRARRRGRPRVDAALPAVLEVGLRRRPGHPRQQRRVLDAEGLGASRRPAASPRSPAPRAASAPRSPRRSRATAPTSSPSTSRRRATRSPRSPTDRRRRAAPGRHRRRRAADARRVPAPSATGPSTSSSTTPASRATARWRA